MKRMEHKQQIIGTDGRMLGEQGKECNIHPAVPAQRTAQNRFPKAFSSGVCVDGGGCGQYKKEQGGLHRGEAIGRLFPLLRCRLLFIFSSFSTKGRASPSFVYNAGLVEVLLYIERYKHHQSAVDGSVGLAAHT